MRNVRTSVRNDAFQCFCTLLSAAGVEPSVVHCDRRQNCDMRSIGLCDLGSVFYSVLAYDSAFGIITPQRC